jgi:gliding motility-associated-like protein
MRIILLVITILFSFGLNAQSGTWTWMHGTNGPNSNGNYGVMGVAAASNNPPAMYGPANWVDNQGNFWIYGGIRTVNTYNAMWKFDVSTSMWTWMQGSSTPNQQPVFGVQGVPSPVNSPGTRSHGAATWTDNQGKLWLFGGIGKDANGNYSVMNDLWKYDPLTNEWTWMRGSIVGNQTGNYGTQGVAAPTNDPSCRSEACAAWSDAAGFLWLFGGQSTGMLNDVWCYNISTNEWTWLNGSSSLNPPGNYGTKGVASASNSPPGRGIHTKWKDAQGNFWIFGGCDMLLPGMYNDVWKYNPASNQWAWISGPQGASVQSTYGNYCDTAGAQLPPSRNESRACWSDSCNFWVYGGGNVDGSTVFGDLWYYTPSIDRWTWVSGSSSTNQPANWGTLGVGASTNRPGSRFGAVSFTDNSGNFWMFGGSYPWPTVFNDLWKYEPDTSCVNRCEAQVSPPVDPTTDELFIPNVFTPNGDGVNDAFVVTANGYTGCRLEIYDRWGVRLYETSTLPLSWDGKCENGKRAMDGTYYFVFAGMKNGMNEIVQKGFLTLLH